MPKTIITIIIIIIVAGLGYWVYQSELVPEEVAQDEEKGSQNIESLIPEGWQLIAKAEGDLNQDNLVDAAIVIEQDVENLFLDEAAPRALLIALQNDKGTYELSIRSDKAILKANEGGVWGDPFYEGLSVDRGSLLINFYGGSNWRWANTYRFRYQDDGWYLIGATLSNYWTVNGEGTTEDYNLLTGDFKTKRTDENGNEAEELTNRGGKDLLSLEEFDVRLPEKNF